jgi:hypothetical protein
MQYRIELASKYGGCNFCCKGELSKDGMRLKYPYKKVYVIYGNQLEIRVCPECLTQLKGVR